MVVNDTAGVDVASLAEAWIETGAAPWRGSSTIMSPPSRRRGSKRRARARIRSPMGVASLAEAWIETSLMCRPLGGRRVASLAEAWIETKPSI